MKIMPPLTIELEVLAEGLGILADATREALALGPVAQDVDAAAG